MNLGSDIYYLELFEPNTFNSIPPSLLWQVAEIAANHEMVESYDLSLIMSRLQLGAALGGPQVIYFRNISINIYLNIFYCCSPVPHVPRRVPLWLDAGHGHGEEARAHHDQDTELALRRAGP